MTLKFSEDFETSTIIFTQCVEKDGDYHLMIPEVVSMIQNIIKTGSLPPEYGDVQNRFIDEVIVSAITPILQLTYVSGTELKNDISFFQECIRLIPWCIMNKHITTTLKIIEILHSRQPFYISYSNYYQPQSKSKETYNKILNTFLEENIVNIVHDMMKNEGNTFFNYSIYFALLSYGHNEINKSLRSSEIQEIVKKFYDFSKSSNIREFDQFHLKLILEIIQKFTDCLIYDANIQLTENINFLIYLLNLDILDKQLIASRILVTYFQTTKSEKFLKELLINSDFSNFILKPELHEEVLETLAPVIIKIMNPALIKSFYEVATKSHITRQKIMFKTIETSLEVMDTDDIMKIIDIFDLSSLHPSLLAGLVPTIATKDKSKAKNIITQILNQSQDGGDVISHLNPIIKCDNQIVKEIWKETITEQLDNPSTSLVDVLKSCVKDKIFDESFISVIFNQILKKGNKIYFDLLTKLYITYDKPVTTQTVQELAQLRKYSELEKFFDELINKKGKKLFDKDSLMAIFNLFRGPVSSYRTICLLQNIVLLFELIDNNIIPTQYIIDDDDRIPSLYALSRIPSLLSDLISIYYTTNRERTALMFEDNITEIVSKIQNINIEEYSKILLTNLENCQEEYERRNMYKLIIESIDKFDAAFDPEDFNLVRNKQKKKTQCFYFEVHGLGINKQFYESFYMTPTELRQKLHFIFPNLENCSILNGNFNIFSFKNLLDAGVKNGDKLTLTTSSIPYIKNTTTIFKYMFDHKVTSLLIQSLKSDISGVNSLKLLKRLPDDYDVLKNNEIKNMTEREIIYYISVLKKQKLSNEIYSSLSQIFMTSGSKIVKYLTKIFLLDFRPKLISFKASDLIYFLGKNSETLNLFAKLIEFDENLIENRKHLLKVLEKADPATASDLSIIYSTIKNSEKFVDEISENLTKNYMFLILSIVNQTKSSEALSFIFDKIQHLLDKNISVVQIIEKIIEKDKNLVKKLSKTNKDQIFSIATSCNDQYQYSAVNIIKEIGCEGYEDKLSKFYSNKTQNWSFSPISPNKSVSGVGLKNLGMTCYMNSVMQQLFALSSFVKTVFDTEDSLESLKQLFSDMSEEKLPYADMSDFVNEWKWGTQKVNCFEQQDALEFLSMLLDSMPKISSQFFIGEYENVLTDEKGEIISKNIENFDSIEVEIKNTIEDSMTSSSVFPDYKIDNKTITVTKTTKVKKFPEVLVIQLKRFDYNLRTFEKIKVNSQFKYPLKLNLKNIEGEETKYNLTGIVAHAGNAIGGHYISFIKFDKNEWKIFDDTDTRIARNHDIYDLYGTSSADQYTPNAYILFYTKKDEKIYQKLEIPEKYKKVTDEKIQNLSELNALYTRSSFELSIISNHLLDFYFNVYMHSTITNYEKIVIDSLSEIDNLFDKLMEREEDVLYCLSNCPNYEILNSLISILKMNSLNFTRDFVNHLLLLIENSGQNWRIVNSICSILSHYILCHPNQNDFIYRSLCGYLLRFYDKPSTALNVVNFSPLFNLFTFEKYPEVKETIKAISNKVVQNENHKSQFESVLAYYADIESLPQIVVQARTDQKQLAMLIKIVFNVMENVQTTKEQLKKLFDTIFIMKEGYASSVLKKIVYAMVMESLERERFLDLISDNLDIILTPILCHLNLNTVKKLAETISLFIVPSACIPPFKESKSACQISTDIITRYTYDEYMKYFVPSSSKKEKITPKISNFTKDELRRANKLKDFVVTFVKSVIEKPIKLSIRSGNYLQHPITVVQRIAYFCGQILGFDFIKPYIIPLFEKLLPKNKNEEFLPCSSLGSLMSMCEIYMDQYVDFIASIEKIDPTTLKHLKDFICNLKDDDLKLFVENKNSIKVITEMANSIESSVHNGIFQIATKALFVTDNKLFFDACIPDMSNNVMKHIQMPKVLTIIDRFIPYISEEKKMSIFRYTIERMVFIASQTQKVDEEKLNETISIANVIGAYIENPVLSEEEIQKIVEFPNPASVSLILKNTNQIEELQKTDKGVYISILALFLSERIEMAMKYEYSVEFWKAAMISPKQVLIYVTQERFVKTSLASRIKTNVFTKGIKLMDEENVVELFGLMTAEIFEDGVNENDVLKKLELIANCRPEFKDSFIGLLPLSKEDLIEKNAQSLINALGLN